MTKGPVLVTGGAGFIGSHVVDRLVERHYDVVVLDDLSGGFVENVNPGARFIQGSVLDVGLVSDMFRREPFKYVYHLAAYAAEGLSHFIKRFNYMNNLIGSVNLINAAVNAGGVECFVFTSSIAVYGKGQVPMAEDMTPRPEDPYGIAKYAVEQDLRESFEMFGLPYVTFRPHNVYGERQNIGDTYRNVIGIFMNQAMRGEPFTIFGDGTQTRAFSHIDDVAAVIAAAPERRDSYNQVFNVGADVPYSVNTLAAAVAAAMNVELRVRYLEARSEVLHAYSAHGRVRAVFGDLISDVSLAEGILRMSKWAISAGARVPKPFSDIEVARNMPPSWARLTLERQAHASGAQSGDPFDSKG
ncbi:MAG TPA: NAD-dependent epimerase/dehydratase family protein [Candidatus Nitrosotalea sp.]|nr:NAD-dependent epimerase/dehydratase family protein [Candidatus Nitrosotalea sp.]